MAWAALNKMLWLIKSKRVVSKVSKIVIPNHTVRRIRPLADLFLNLKLDKNNS